MGLAKDYGDTNFVTGMRAWAALAVVLIHAGGGGLRQLGPIGNALADFGMTGVYAFFVISGFSVCASLRNSGSYGSYLVRRAFRLLPPYFLIIAWAGYSAGADATDMALHFALLNWISVDTANSILSVEWSIPIEAAWYILLPPLLVVASRSAWWCAGVLLAAFVSYYVATAAYRVAGLPIEAFHYSPLRYAFLFALGMSAYLIRSWYPPQADRYSDGAVLAAAAIIASHVLWDFSSPYLAAGLATWVIVAMGQGGSLLVRMLFSNRPAIFVGTVSYSVYLLHVLVLGHVREYVAAPFLVFVFAAAASVAVSCITYLAVERPSVRLGSLVARALEQRRLSAA